MTAITRVLYGDFSAVTALRERYNELVATWRKRIEYRRELAELSFRDIQDIGIDPSDIDREIAKPFWRE